MALENPLNTDSGAAASTPTTAPPTTAPAPPETTMASGSETLTPLPAPPPSPQLNGSQVQPEQAAPTRHPSFMQHLGPSLVGSILSNLAGPHQAIDHYEVDGQGKNKAIMRDLHPRERLQRLAQAALEGLAAGSQVGPQKSSGGAWAAGLGAGAEASMQRAQQQDLLKRQQGKEDYEAGERAKTDNAIRPTHIPSTFTLSTKAI